MEANEFNDKVTTLSFTMKPFALNLTRNLEDARDLVQETVYRAMINQNSFTDGTNMKAWIYTIMKNLFINDYRRQKQRNTFLEVKEDLSYVKNTTSTAKNEGESNIETARIMLKINNLTVNYQVPFMMHYNGFKYSEIASHLNLPIGTIKSRIHLARKKLQMYLTEKPAYNA